MKDLLFTLLHLAVMAATLCGPGGMRAVIAEHLLLKQQLIVLRRPRPPQAPHYRDAVSMGQEDAEVDGDCGSHRIN